MMVNEEDYNIIAEILVTNLKARNDNRVLIKEYYRKKGYTLDEAFSNDELLNYQSIERAGRNIKARNPKLKVDKEFKVDEYKEMALDIPVIRVDLL